jgi:asparagine synthase (glutamine-hydrolysing)
MGGVPTPIPELEDLLTRLQLRALARQLKVWALQQRKPWIHLFFETARGFLPLTRLRVARHRRPPSWLDAGFIKRNHAALQGYEERLKVFGPLPSFQENLSTLEVLRRQVACTGVCVEPFCEKRYPYLDRGLLEFIFAIPREQLVRPGQRRSLMRRALVGIVPDELLHRKRKAFVVRRPLAGIHDQLPALMQISGHMLSAALGIVDSGLFAEALRAAAQGKETSLVSLTRMLGIEFWLRNLPSGVLASRQVHAEADGNAPINGPVTSLSP